jgi:ribosomal protein S18 acetylase RimI-like enzyme
MATALNDGLEATDLEPLVEMTEAAGVFRPVEVEVAREVLGTAVLRGEASGYSCAVIRDATHAGAPLGYAVWGATPCTDGTFDLYWLVVDPIAQGRGLASRLLAHAEESARRQGGRQLVVETSGGPEYIAARHFYENRGFTSVALIPDFYRPGDPKIVYLKSLQPTH